MSNIFMENVLILFQFVIVLLAILLGARKGGVALGIYGGIGLAILVFVFGLKPQSPPIDVMLMIVAVVTAAATLQAAGGIDYLVRVAEKIIRKRPSAITIVAPIVAYIFTFIAGTGHIAYALLPIISEVATDAKVRPERPMAVSVIASQQAITASPISAATAALLALLVAKSPDIQLYHILMICIPSTLIGVIVAAIIQMFVGVDLEKDPEYQKRLKEGFVKSDRRNNEEKPSASAKISVWIFLLSVFMIVLLGSLKSIRPSWGEETMSMPHIIEILMLTAAALMLIFTKTDVAKIPTGSIFSAGIQAVIAIFGIAWMGDTFFLNNIDFFKNHLTEIVTQYPWLFAIALFVMSIMLFSQAATVRALMPLGISLGIPVPGLIAMFPSVNGYFFIPNYPTVIAAINFDKTGTTRIGKYVINHSFQLPGFVATIVSVAVGFLIAGIIF